jgi:hypothetical protein
MADVRLSARLARPWSMLALASVAAVAACGQADAQSQPPPGAVRSGITAPKGWKPLPAIAAAVQLVAPAPGVTVDGIEAWGEPAMGCYAVWLALHGSGGAPDVVADQVLESLASEKIAVRDVVKPGDDGVLSLGVERGPYRGRLRARVDDGRLAALACVSNQREPAACEVACTGVLGAMP